MVITSAAPPNTQPHYQTASDDNDAFSQEVIWELTGQFYRALNSGESVKTMYKEDACLIYGVEGKDSKNIFNNASISEYYQTQKGNHFCITNIDFLKIDPNTAIVQIIGEIKDPKQEFTRFVQNFVLSHNGLNMYLITKDICRTLRSEYDDDIPEAPEQEATPEPSEISVAAAKASPPPENKKIAEPVKVDNAKEEKAIKVNGSATTVSSNDELEIVVKPPVVEQKPSSASSDSSNSQSDDGVVDSSLVTVSTEPSTTSALSESVTSSAPTVSVPSTNGSANASEASTKAPLTNGEKKPAAATAAPKSSDASTGNSSIPDAPASTYKKPTSAASNNKSAVQSPEPQTSSTASSESAASATTTATEASSEEQKSKPETQPTSSQPSAPKSWAFVASTSSSKPVKIAPKLSANAKSQQGATSKHSHSNSSASSSLNNSTTSTPHNGTYGNKKFNSIIVRPDNPKYPKEKIKEALEKQFGEIPHFEPSNRDYYYVDLTTQELVVEALKLGTLALDEHNSIRIEERKHNKASKKGYNGNYSGNRYNNNNSNNTNNNSDNAGIGRSKPKGNVGGPKRARN